MAEFPDTLKKTVSLDFVREVEDPILLSEDHGEARTDETFLLLSISISISIDRLEDSSLYQYCLISIEFH
jgi:hypothetical protein